MLIDVATTTRGDWAGRQGGDGEQSGNGSGRGADGKGDAYRWIALSNTTLAMVMATIDGSIVIVALPAIFRGINLYEPDIGSPWGGRGPSGAGSAYGPEGMDAYLTSKSVFLPSFRAPAEPPAPAVQARPMD